MAKDKDKHPSWFKMKLERRELVRQLSPETAVNVLLACWDFLETGEKPANLSPIEALRSLRSCRTWKKLGRDMCSESRQDMALIGRYRPISNDTEVEEETEVEVRSRLYKGIRERSRFRAPLHPPRQRRQILAV